ncbi:MAG: two-component system, NarL family, nitrate/nitrite response regulator NarL [Acetobacteraceae bacterium]|jgi:two-component system, NarL family, nitrate/nitrite response regulator NarL|nr:two-component system, NarL family, nitrate/nitrite response regulator NarL [Acetobacteraceae bacterium]
MLMITSNDEDLDPSDLSNVCTLPFPSHDPERASDGAVSIDRHASPSMAPKVVALSSRIRKKRQAVPAAIIDKSALFRAGLMHILSGSQFCVTAACPTLQDLPEQALDDTPCVALIGLDKDVEAVLSRIAVLKQKHKGLRVIVFSEHLHPEQFLAALGAGADGYLLRNEISPDAVLKSLELVLVEGVVVPQGFTKILNSRAELQVHTATEIARLEPIPPTVQLQPEPDSAPPRPVEDAIQNGFLERLSDREHVILMQLTQGASNKHIARELNIAEATVKVHVKSLLRKIRVSNRTQAAMWAMNHVGPIARQPPRRLN